MDSQGITQGEHERFDQILSQFLLKSLHIILDSRVPSIRPYNRSGEVKKSDKWFCLVLGDRPAAFDNLNFWQRNLMEPMVIDIILIQQTKNSSSFTTSSLGTFVETVIERWVVQYEYLRTVSPQLGDASYKKMYKKSIILLRSLYSMMRLLPAYKAFRKLSSSYQVCDFDISYKVSSFSTPFSREEEELMKRYSFIPVDTLQGCLSISVTYCDCLSCFNLETSASFPPEIITDYVGSPATDPLRAFPSMEKGVHATSFPLRAAQPPASSPSQRPHSWTRGLLGQPSLQNQPFVGSPPVYSRPPIQYEIPHSSPDVYRDRTLHHRVQSHRKSSSFEDYQLSPPFPPSFSPSSPTYLVGGKTTQSHQHLETSPISIPHPLIGRSPRYLSPNFSDPNKHSLPPPSPRSTKNDPSSQESLSGIRLLRKSGPLRTGELHSGISNYHSGQRVPRDSKEDSGRFSSLLSSSGSPRIGFSRSSSRVSFQDDLDDCDFSCPFIVDDVYTDLQPSQSVDGKKASEFAPQDFSTAKKSQEAAVGALVHTLRTAPPLRHDSSGYSLRSLKNELEGEAAAAAASSFLIPRKTSDALEELRGYKEMKDHLLSKSGSQVVSKEEP